MMTGPGRWGGVFSGRQRFGRGGGLPPLSEQASLPFSTYILAFLQPNRYFSRRAVRWGVAWGDRVNVRVVGAGEAAEKAAVGGWCASVSSSASASLPRFVCGLDDLPRADRNARGLRR